MAIPFWTKDVHVELDANMNTALKNGFPPFLNEQDLRSAIESVCAEFGTVKTLRMFSAAREPQGRGRSCLCLLQLDPPTAQNALRAKLKVSTFGNSLEFIADVDEKWTGPSM